MSLPIPDGEFLRCASYSISGLCLSWTFRTAERCWGGHTPPLQRGWRQPYGIPHCAAMLTGVDDAVPCPFVRLTVTAPIMFASPCTLNNCSNTNELPNAVDAALLYQASNSGSTFRTRFVCCIPAGVLTSNANSALLSLRSGE